MQGRNSAGEMRRASCAARLGKAPSLRYNYSDVGQIRVRDPVPRPMPRLNVRCHNSQPIMPIDGAVWPCADHARCRGSGTLSRSSSMVTAG